MSTTPETRRELSAWTWLGLPLFPVVLLLGTYALDAAAYVAWFNPKEGVLEWMTAAFLLVAIGAGVVAVRYRKHLPNRKLRIWTFLLTAGCIYFLGEEISWGQWIWHWESPAFFKEFNWQGETNLHNMSRWANEKPRLLVEIAILIGIILSLRVRLGATCDGWRAWFLPTWVCFPAGVIAILIRVPDRLEKFFSIDFEDGYLSVARLSEPQELYFALYMMIYALSLSSRLLVVATDHAAAPIVEHASIVQRLAAVSDESWRGSDGNT